MKNYKTQGIDISLLILRIVFGMLLFLNHGWMKILAADKMFHSFPDPIGLGAEVSFVLIVFAEAFCSLLLVLGLFSRYALVPLIIAMSVAAFVVHGADSLASKETPLIYLAVFVALIISGPGKYSFDYRLKI